MDGAYAAVRFPSKEEHRSAVAGSGSANNGASEDASSLLADCRLLRKDELMVVKGSSAPRMPDCFQRLPKKITVAENGQIITVTVDNEGT